MKRIMVAVGAAVVLRAQDAAKVDARHYTVMLENDQVRVLKVHFGPGEKSVLHSHPSAVAVFLSDGKIKFHMPDGTAKDAEVKAGSAMFHAAETHLPENAGDKGLDVVVVELKDKK